MRRRLLLAFAGMTLLGLAFCVFLLADDKRGFSVRYDTRTTVLIGPGREACRRSVKPKAAGTNALRFRIDTMGHRGPPLSIRVFRGYTRPDLVAAGQIAGGYTGRHVLTGRIKGSVAGAYATTACVDNRGSTPISILPRVPRGRQKHFTLEGRSGFAELSLTIVREPKASLLSLMPTVFRRATLFRPGWVHVWGYWLMAAVLALVVPLLLGAALAAASDGARVSEASEARD